MTIYGPCANPRIIIAGQVYQVYDTLEAHEYIVVDSRKKTIIKRLANGTEQNIFIRKQQAILYSRKFRQETS